MYARPPSAAVPSPAPALPEGTASPRVPFLVGVTGHMTLDAGQEAMVREQLRRVLGWVQGSQALREADGTLHGPLGLVHTPVQVLSSLAPGVDQIAVDEALNLGCQVRCPLPFPPEFYRHASTFRRGVRDAPLVQEADPPGTPPEQREQGLPVLTDEDRERQRAFDQILERVGRQHAFWVRHHDDLELRTPISSEALADDLRDVKQRNLRYRAAGEHVSTNCDLLIAVCDVANPQDEPTIDDRLSPREQPGTAFVVRSHLRGLEPGILSGAPRLTWAENGPVVRIYCPRATKKQAEGEGGPRSGDIAVWHPLADAYAGDFETHWHERKMEALATFAGHMEELNAGLAEREQRTRHAPPPPDPVAKMLVPKGPYRPRTEAEQWLARALRAGQGLLTSPPEQEKPRQPAAPPVLLPGALPELGHLARLRHEISALNGRLDATVKKHIRRLCEVAFVAAVLLQLQENWVTAKDSGEMPGWRGWCFAVAVVLIAAAWARHLYLAQRNVFDRQNDYRAIAEGLRVQFYWTAAGTGQSVAATYLQRVQGELSWIRAAVASAGQPYARAADEFTALKEADKGAWLKTVCEGWISEQEWYFAKKIHELGRSLRRWQTVGRTLIIAGTLMWALNILGDWKDFCALLGGLPGACCQWPWGRMLGAWAALALGLWLLVQVIVTLGYGAAHDEHDDRAEGKGPRRLRSALYFPAARQAWVGLCALLRALARPGWMAFPGLSLGLVLFGLLRSLPEAPWLAEPGSLIAFSKNAVLILGGLCLAMARFKFLEENLRRYRAMHGLFRASRLRIDGLLRDYQSRLEAYEAVKRLVDDGQDGTSAQAFLEPLSRALERSVRAIQDHLVALGREALQENTDWLLMHRNNPVEPMLPGG